MIKMTDDSIIDEILIVEGSEYTNDPTDKGGPTRYGITLKTLKSWRHPKPVMAKDVEALTELEARQIYKARYILDPKFDKVSDVKLRAFLIDSGVQHGTVTAVRMFQEALGAKPDGILGGETLAKLVALGPVEAFKRVFNERLLRYARIVRNDPTQSRFIVGWITRVIQFNK